MYTVRVWDLPTRVFHWLLAASVVAMVVTAKLGGGWMEWHLRLGHAVLALLVFRFAWGLLGGYWSRFSSFMHSPAALLRHVRGQGRVEDSVGHSPLGALSVFALYAVLLVQVGSGLVSDDEIAYFGSLVRFVQGDTVSMATEYHKDFGPYLVIGLVVLHLLAIAFYQRIKRTDLIGPMLHGDKTLPQSVPSSRDGALQRALALILAGVAAAGAYALFQLGVG